ncbi:hypothetical protein F8M41_022776 [Gigaspora margarita]|uniref:Uncharacterized protein n=1 Tax=Gigaspora margarita TaxID=4874 RepID=A0A8H4AEJ6_GIGMA|nr:hypothetical protein F8M41_022776 [Gigaspora margarita]
MISKISQYGYHFDYNYGNLNESTLELLRLWPTNKQILQTIKYSHQLTLFVVIHKEEVSTNIDNKMINFTNNKQDENNEISVSIAITEASCKIKHITTQNYNGETIK